jgi:hypothetical protein
MIMRFYGTPGNMYRYNKFGQKTFGPAGTKSEPSQDQVGAKSGENEIKVCVREVYGNTLVYPVCNKALSFAKIAGKKTLTPEVLTEIKALGYAVTTVLKQEA